MSTRFFLLSILLYTTQFIFAQKGVKGKVINDSNSNPLEFVTVSFDRGNTGGTLTDTDGTFIVDAPKEVKMLSFYLLGFKPLEISLDTIKRKDRDLVVRLIPDEYTLAEVVLRPNENPAYEYVRRVVKNKDKHDPTKSLQSYSYTSYNKFIQDYWRDEEGNLPDSFKVKSILGKIKFLKPSEDKHLFIMESVTEKLCMQPDFSQEKIIATKIAGLKNPSFAPASDAFLPFSYYSEQVWLLDNYYINPITEGTLKRYEFNIRDTLYTPYDTLINIEYYPRKGKNFAGMRGEIQVSKKYYTVTYFEASPAESTNLGLKLSQEFILIDSTQWFPNAANLQLGIKGLPGIDAGIIVNGYTWFTNVKLNPASSKDDFETVSVQIAEDATLKDEKFWNAYRADSLTTKETETYAYLEKLGKKFKLDFLQGIVENFSASRMPIGFIDLDINKLATFNFYEGPRLGFGFHTNDKVSKIATAGAFAGYGFWDKNWKYGGDISLLLNKANQVKLQAIYQRETTVPGDTWLTFYDYPSFLANLGSSLLDLETKKEINLSFRALHYMRAKALVRQSERTIPYDYFFTETPVVGDWQRTFNFTEAGILVRYAYGQKLYESLKRTFTTSTPYPILSASYIKGFSGILNGQFDYHRVEGSVIAPYKTKAIGNGEVMVMGGFVNGIVPADKLYFTNLYYDHRYPIVVENTFQTVRYTEFLHDRFAYLFLRHNFSSLLFKTKKWKPEIELMHNMGWGKLTHPEYHTGVSTSTMRRGFYETGLVLDNIVRINYLNILYIGIGGGAFYRYGPYHLSKEISNFTFKTSLRITTK